MLYFTDQKQCVWYPFIILKYENKILINIHTFQSSVWRAYLVCYFLCMILCFGHMCATDLWFKKLIFQNDNLRYVCHINFVNHHDFLICFRWPCLLDPSTTAGTFLRYRDTNFLQAVSPKEMEADRIRKALLGGLRYIL